MPDCLPDAALEPFKKAFQEDNARLVETLLERHPEIKKGVNDPVEAFDAPIITRVRSRAMLDVLLRAGADINAKSRWWAGGFSLLHGAAPDLADYAISKGAVVDAHAAARLGKLDVLRSLISAQPNLVHGRGGDGQMPLHFASTVEIADFLLDHGADIDARDIDHESTAAQYAVRDRQPVVKRLIERGCKTDILLAAALGDSDLTQRHLRADPQCIRMRVSHEYFPMINPKSGGTIYQWTLGWYVSAHQVAKEFGHEELYRYLMEKSPPELRLLTACWTGDEEEVRAQLKDASLLGKMTEGERSHLALAARNNALETVRLMLLAGFPITARGQHGGTPSHWAAWRGNAAMVDLFLRHQAPLELKDIDYSSTPLGWAIHASEHGWDCGTGEYGRVVELLLKAGAKLPKNLEGNSDVRKVLQPYFQ